MKPKLSLEQLWRSSPMGEGVFGAANVSDQPSGARRYLQHAITAGAPLANAVRLRMHGEIKLKTWCRFTAEQVIRWDRGMIWRATAHLHGLPINGADYWLDGEGGMRWKLFGLFPVLKAGGPDITRAAAGRVNIESIWLPSALCAREVAWSETHALHPRAHFTAHGETTDLDCEIDARGALRSVCIARWGNPEGEAYHHLKFGGLVEEQRRFGAYTIPSRLRVGWHFGTPHFETEGEFFRVRIDEAQYR